MTLHILCSSSFFLPCTCSHSFHTYFPTSISTSSSSPFSSRNTYSIYTSTLFHTPRSSSNNQLRTQDAKDAASTSELLDDDFLGSVSAAADANQALEMIAQRSNSNSGVVSVSDCRLIISAALDRDNADLALSLFSSMRSSFDPVAGKKGPLIERWKWSRPDVHTYTLLIRGLAASLRVSDALKIIAFVCRVGVSPSEEVPFGKVVKCPTCMVAMAVAQPQNGIQIVSCSKCRYKYELVSGNICKIESEEIRISSCRTQHGYSSLEERIEIFSNDEAKHSSCCPFTCGGNAFWSGTDTQICH